MKKLKFFSALLVVLFLASCSTADDVEDLQILDEQSSVGSGPQPPPSPPGDNSSPYED